jgi:hypothetical protein
MSRLIQRAPITAAVLAALRAANRPVGDNEMPRGNAAGWVGQPNAEGRNYIAYSVLTATGGAGSVGGPLTEPGSDVHLGFVITNYGVSRTQCEDQADLMRLQLMALSKTDVPQWVGTPYEYQRRIQIAIVTGYGPVQRMGDQDPKVYGQTDSIALLTTG